MIKIVQNSSLLRFDAPEWYPDTRKGIMGENNNRSEEIKSESDYGVRLHESINHDGQMKNEV